MQLSVGDLVSADLRLLASKIPARAGEEYPMVPRQWEIGNLTRFVMVIGPISSIFDYLTYFMMLYESHTWDNPTLFQAGWFVESHG